MTKKSSNDVIRGLMALCLEMGRIIRAEDEESANYEYWTNDGNAAGPEYVPDPRYYAAEKHLAQKGRKI